MISEMALRAIRHWTEHRPQWVEELKEAGRLEEVAQSAADQATVEIDSLMASGLQRHEAEEIAMNQYITTPPTDDQDWEMLETEEDRQRQAGYAETIRATRVQTDQ
ncbi:hypothetical protein [Pandoraea sp. ISTKB]|uniref:hypothetical protein n=1 Tax=Pandoraea sp. ISTKB TaxID=1586708 RepID=UPI001112D362|nr:hypothetical protein [Pandoraea sp. ISTKB]